jgi:hypothetical protein
MKSPLFLFLLLTLACGKIAYAKPTEEKLLAMAQSGDFNQMKDALDRLPNYYPESTNAIALIRGILVSNKVIVVTEKRPVGQSEVRKRVKSALIARVAARSIGHYHIRLNPDELKVIYDQLLHDSDPDSTMDGLKALRELKNPEAASEILPFLHDENYHIIRDAIRTLGAIGDESVISQIEPFLDSGTFDVQLDAKNAIKSIKSKELIK